MELIKVLWGATLGLGLWASCAPQTEREQTQTEPRMSSIEREKRFVAQERAAIEAYVLEHQWEDDVKSDGMGMVWLPVVDGKGPIPQTGDWVVYDAKVYLLDDSGVTKYRDTLRLGYDQVELVLHQALANMKKGDESIVLVPSFLAHGMAGDLDKVPPRSPLRYDLKLVDIIE